MDLLQKLVGQINSMNTAELVELNNAYCRAANCPDSEIFNNDDEFFEMFFSNRVIDAVRAVSYGDYNYSHDYVKFNGYGNLESFNHMDASDLVDFPQNIAEYAIEHQDEFDMFDFEIAEEDTE